MSEAEKIIALFPESLQKTIYEQMKEKFEPQKNETEKEKERTAVLLDNVFKKIMQ